MEAATWAVAHLSERQAVFGHGDLLAAERAREPGAVTAGTAERAIAGLEREGGLHAAKGLEQGNHWTTDAALARESEAIALMRAGQGAEKTIMRAWIAETKLHGGRLNEGQKEAVKLILCSTDRVLGVQGYAGTGKTTMLNRLRTLAESRGYNTAGLAPSVSAARTRERESGRRQSRSFWRAMRGSSRAGARQGRFGTCGPRVGTVTGAASRAARIDVIRYCATCSNAPSRGAIGPSPPRDLFSASSGTRRSARTIW